MALFVKFVPWNENTYYSLKYKTIKFSTAYELNDYHEFGYIAPGLLKSYEDRREKIKEIVENKFEDYTKRCALIDNLKMSPYSSESCTNFYKQFKTDEDFSIYLEKFDKEFSKDDRGWLSFIIENIAYSSVGIFSCSKIDIFKTKWAQLLYAYYADCLKGLALIYEQNTDDPQSKLKKIDYKDFLSCSQKNIAALKWADNDFRDMSNFNRKLDIWKHEKELRICSIPGIRRASDFGISLKAVLYTQRIVDDLCKLREVIPEEVFLKEICVGYGDTVHYFKVLEKREEVSDWIKSNLST